MNLPGYEFLSAPLWILNILHIVTLSLHLLAMNFIFGGLATLLLGRIDNRWQNPAVIKYIKLLPTVMAATVTLGVAPLLFSQLIYPKQIYAAAITSAWLWLLIIPVAIIGYYFLYGAASDRVTVGRRSIYLWLTLVGFVYISFVYSSVFSMAESNATMQSAYAANQSGLVLNPDAGSYVVRWLHMILGALTVGGFLFGWVGRDDEAAYRTGKQVFLWGMIGASLAGVAYLVTLGDFLIPFMRTPGIWAMTLGVLLSLGSVHFYFKRKFTPAAVMVVLSMILMVYTRHHVRLLHLASEYDPATMAIQPQWLIFVLFLIFFVIAIATVWYMLKLFFAPSD
jgi:hypothetical protein